MPPAIPPPDAAVSYSRQYRRCGKADCAACRPGLPGHGPYWYARWQEGGRTRSRYLGRQLPPGHEDTLEDAVGAASSGSEATRAASFLSGAAHDGDATGESADASPLVESPGNDAIQPRSLSSLPSRMRPPLRVRTLGAFIVWRGEDVLEPGRWSRRTVAALFKCLLTMPGQRLAREQAIDLLWPDADHDHGDANLRAAVHRLRAVLDEPGATTSYLRSEGAVLILDPPLTEVLEEKGAMQPTSRRETGGDWLDADVFARAARHALTSEDGAMGRTALSLYGGDYLPDDPYEDWAATRREELRQLHRALLLYVARLDAGAGRADEAVRCLRLLLAADPCHEPATRLLMELLSDRGERVEALRTYEVLVRALRDDLDVVPTPETEVLRDALVAANTPLPPRPRATLTNLPAALTSFVGRGRELAAVQHALAQGPTGCRLLTVTGVGGGGKTRLALAVAAAVQPLYPDGVWLVELAALVDPALIPATVATALDLREAPGASFTAALSNALQTQRLLLVLDNCEHLVAACASLVTRLLRDCPHLQILATSREALNIDGETVWRLPPLSLPPLSVPMGEGSLPSILEGQAPAEEMVEAGVIERLQRFEAVQLFLERAQASRPDFTLTRRNATAVVWVCRRLDGLPLALELAAARLHILSVQDVAARLDDRFRLLTAGNRAALPRHQTLRGVLDWSYAMLSLAEKVLLRRLAVFAGGWTLEGAEAVCVGGPVRADDVLDLLAGLESKSLLTLMNDGESLDEESESRYGLLETVRQYAADHLAANEDLEAIGAAHAAYVLALVERAAPGLRGPRQRRRLDQLEAEHDNIRAALTWSMREHADDEDRRTALRLCSALGLFWLLHGHLSEGRRWLTLSLSQSPVGGDGAPQLVAGALRVAGMLAERQHDYDRAAGALEKSMALYHALDDSGGRAAVFNELGLVAWDRSDYTGAHDLFMESLVLCRALGDDRGAAAALNNLARVHRNRGAGDRATTLYEESLALWKRVGEPWGIAMVLGNLGLERGERGDYQRALALHLESLELRRELGDKLGVAWSLINVATVAVRLGDYEQAVVLFAEGLALARQVGDRATVTDIVEGLAEVALGKGSMERAAQLFGGVEVLRTALGDPLSPAERARYDRNVAFLRGALGDSRFTTAWREGQSRGQEDIIAYACN